MQTLHLEMPLSHGRSTLFDLTQHQAGSSASGLGSGVARKDRRMTQGTPGPAPERSPDGRQRLLDAALQHLGDHSEADLRVVEIAQAADVAVGLIRHHFGSRDGLVAAAQQVRLEGAVKADLEAAEAFIRDARTSEELIAGIRRLTVALLDPERADIRLARVAVIGTAHGRSDVREQYARIVGGLLDDLTKMVVAAQRSSLARTDLDPRSIATFIQAYALGMILYDLDPDATDPLSMVEVITTAIRSVISAPTTDGPPASG